MTGIFRSPQAEATMQRWHDVFASTLPWPHERTQVQTSIGTTGVLVAGPEGGVPIVCFHGAAAGAPHALSQVGDLGARRRLYGVDIVGQSVRSAQVRPDGPGMGRWVVEVLDALGLERAVLFGVSWGGWVALQGALAAGPRCAGLALLVPAGVVRAEPWPAFTKLGLPMMAYQLFPTPARRDRMLSALFTTPDPLWAAFIADSMRCLKLNFSEPALLSDAELARIEAPTLAMAAAEDLQFPGAPLLARLEATLPALKHTVLIEGCKHVPAFDGSFTPRLLAELEGFVERWVA